jgi:hypothetical protein
MHTTASDLETLERLNRGYVRSAGTSDVLWYGENLAEDILGDVALIHAGFRDRKPDGQVGLGRYTDIWARRQGRWLCVATHFTRF